MRYDRLRPASKGASKAAQGSSRKRDTAPEIALRKELRARGLRSYRVDAPGLAGRPDVVFRRERIAVFCDGDFWHGRDLENRLAKLKRGHNAPYWVEKIGGNVARDKRVTEQLELDGWKVLRFWETELTKDAASAAEVVAEGVKARKR